MCAHCHDIYDRRKTAGAITYSREYIERKFDNARLETIINRIERGIIK
jgi:hypothetical protein